MRFSDIPGNKSVKQQLLTAAKGGRISHAQLFLGEQGSAALPMAWAYAQYIACEQALEDDSCGSCASCLKYQKGAHPDLHWVFPVVTGKATHAISDHYMAEWREVLSSKPFLREQEWYAHLGVDNKQGFISVNEAAELSKKMRLKSFEGAHKVVIIWQAEKMHAASANKLLKLLEEPPAKTLFILVSSQKEQLLTTIISRLQITKINRLNDQEMNDFLMNKQGLEVAEAQQLTQLAEGNINTALRMMKGDEMLAQNTLFFQEWMRVSYQANIQKVGDWIDKVAKIGREQQKSFLRYALHMVRECLVHNFADDQLQRLRKEEYAFVQKFAPFIHENNSLEIIEELEKAEEHIARNGSAKIIFMDLSLKLVLLLRVKSLNLQ
jgi:DNA polymerase III subunit delta'